MNVGELKKALDEAEGILSAAGSKAAGKDLRSFLQVFDGREHEDINVFFDELRRVLTAATSSQTTPGSLNTDRIEHHVRALNAAGASKPAFEMALSGLSKDRAISKDDVDVIAHRYAGGRSKWSSKSEALAAIREWFDHNALQAVKMQQVDRGTPWKAKRA